jgi:hypothetical protein
VVENSDPKDDELKNIIAESQLSAKSADQLNRRLLSFQAKDIAKNDTFFLVKDTKLAQNFSFKPNAQSVVKVSIETEFRAMENDAMKPVKEGAIESNQEIKVSGETGSKPLLQIFGSVFKNPNKSSELDGFKSSQQNADNSSSPVNPKQLKHVISTLSRQQVCKEVSESATIKPADTPKNPISTPKFPGEHTEE